MIGIRFTARLHSLDSTFSQQTFLMTEEGLRKRKEQTLSKGQEPLLNGAGIYDESEEKREGLRTRRTLPTGSWLVCIFLTAFALWTRLYKINWNDHVVWDEAHFG